MNTLLKNSVASVAIIGLLVSGPLFAEKREDGRGWKKGPPSPAEALARMDEQLGLSDEQAVEMLVVLQQQAAERDELRAQSMEAIGPEICAQRAEAMDSILAILTPDQAEQFALIKEERRSRAAERQQDQGRGRPDCSMYEAET